MRENGVLHPIVVKRHSPVPFTLDDLYVFLHKLSWINISTINVYGIGGRGPNEIIGPDIRFRERTTLNSVVFQVLHGVKRNDSHLLIRWNVHNLLHLYDEKQQWK